MARPEHSLLEKFSADRPGPSHVWQVSTAAIRRWKAGAETLPEKMRYRPKTLEKVSAALDALTLPGPVAAATLATHKVAPGETLSKLASRYYGKGKAALWPEIFAANRDQIDDPDEIFVGQDLRIPHPAEAMPPAA
jgi:nucleoid-associated protein YgaU